MGGRSGGGGGGGEENGEMDEFCVGNGSIDSINEKMGLGCGHRMRLLTS